MEFESFALLLVIFLPFAAALVVFLLPKRVKWIREILSLLVAASCAALAFRFFVLNSRVSLSLDLFASGNFTFAFDVGTNALSLFMLLFTTLFAFLIVLYSLNFMKGKAKGREYYTFLLAALGGAAGVFVSQQLLILLLFWEVVSISLYFLITTGGKGSKEGATKTMAMIGAADGCLLLGIGLLWYLTGSFSLDSVTVAVADWRSVVCFILLMIGAITKAGAMPFHSWIPKASEKAPASVMALLPASIDKLLGIYLLFVLCTRVFVLPWGLRLTLMIIGAVTIVSAVMMALVQHKLTRLLSYHAISQVGYMVLGIGTGIPLAIAGGLFHMLNHAIYKSSLFLTAGAVEQKTGTVELEQLGGLAKAMPVTFISCLIASFSISGVPFFNGFVSKWMIYQGLVEGGSWYFFIFLIAAMFGSALTLASFIKVLYSVFLGRTSALTRKVKSDVGILMQIPMLVLSLLCLLFGVWFMLPLNQFIFPALNAAPAFIGSWDSLLAILFLAGGLLVGIVVYTASKTGKKARVVDVFTGGENLPAEPARIPGTDFYRSIEESQPFSAIYAAQKKGYLDPYNWFGRLGLACSAVLKKMHGGKLPLYVFWILAGFGIVLAVILLYGAG